MKGLFKIDIPKKIIYRIKNKNKLYKYKLEKKTIKIPQ